MVMFVTIGLGSGSPAHLAAPLRPVAVPGPVAPRSLRQVSDSPAGMTLFPGSVRSGEVLRFILDGESRPTPGDTVVVATHHRGDTVRAERSFQLNGIRWVELRKIGYVEAARLDRFPQPIDLNLAPGLEGLISGRVLPWSYAPSDLVAVPDSLKVRGLESRTILLRQEAVSAFQEMIRAAGDEGVVIRIFSGWRSADYQMDLYERNVTRRGPAQRVSAAPGRSEHQLGTAVDIGTPDVSLLVPAIVESEAGQWVARRAAEFGIVMSFSRDRHERRGVAFEPWHLRWVGAWVDEERGW